MVTTDDVRKIANLADIGLDDEEISEFAKQCSGILEYFAVLDTLDQDKPLVHERYNILREDEVLPSLSQEESLQNAGLKEKGYFKAPRVM
ncbi:MAG TPA: Asp-tRNA(Asn)/Glu-tRNA(Gln) amidotransferase subunit GatC [Methanospirillum sp.]|jgi:aspartyl-tRNA(Asn)/glutamyl-tRNA(Gln) amidotransferase subunit C|uniref:Asp-tRNA(Asn)/Glu-tRNA(Gln) amidotransferase subunit GatC n=1 Tax=Methanospirillum sp. TaxID=45200 RepID=UPI0009CFA749|nr:Asp-tRNA(Asn)/Glu-tRNA(Gln) amidotransferase subunit GatC [Methanospirillum sp.]OQB37654.1 MAG: aspartyl/glutamyl-tRNA amidotransferase subunit C [Euryarchaeota archaeon ADurb.Bin165]HPY59146.1 Asp-tRNA(Asn)/Glu-tRNA(Gln) amidotransferase subunit GatC [Methanospirillum sp.]HQB99423.1 Asp-tRNA(Asn)/Glu-tRNA(Gln) amidotransferase subunit GatC [Methanospirillum sp.]